MPLTSVINTATLPKQADVITQAEVLALYLLLTGSGQVGTATNGDSTSVIDVNRLRSGGYDPEELEGAYVRISTTTDAAAPVGEIRVIEKYLPSEGRFEVSPRFTAAVENGDTYQIFRYPHPQDVLDHLDAVLTMTGKFPHIAFATDLPDGDMEASDLSAWTASAQMDTASGKTEKRDIVTDRVQMVGKRYLQSHLTSGQTSGYMESTPMGVMPQMVLHASVLVQTNDHASAVAKLSIWDKTNDVELDSASVTRQLAAARLRIPRQVTVPANCSSVAIRLYNEQASGQTGPLRFDEVVFYAAGSPDVTCPSWVKGPDDVRAVYRYIDSGGFTPSVGNVLQSPVYMGEKDANWVPRDEAYGVGYTTLVSSTRRINEPLFIMALRHEEAFANDTEEKYLDLEYVTTKLIASVYESLGTTVQSANYNIKNIQRQAAEWRGKAAMHENELERRIVRGQPRQGPALITGGGMGAIRAVNR